MPTTYYTVDPQTPSNERLPIAMSSYSDNPSTALTRTKTIHGVAYRKEDGTTVSGLTVYMIRKRDGFQVSSTVTDESGNYSFTRDASDTDEYRFEGEIIESGVRKHGTTDWNLTAT